MATTEHTAANIQLGSLENQPVQGKQKVGGSLFVRVEGHGCGLHRARFSISLAESQKLNIWLLLGRKVNNAFFI